MLGFWKEVILVGDLPISGAKVIKKKGESKGFKGQRDSRYEPKP